MSKKMLSTILIILLSIGIAGCSSGGSEQPGISQEENIANNAAASIANYKTDAANQLTIATQAVADAQAAFREVQAATTSTAARAAKDKLDAALVTAQKALKDAQYDATQSASYVSNASKVSSTASSDAQSIADTAAEIRRLVEPLSSLSTQAEEKVKSLVEQEKAKEEAEQAERLAASLLKASTTSYSYNRADSVIHDYKDSAKRDTLLTEIKKNTNLVAGGTSCTTGSASNPGPCFAGGTIGTGERKGEIVAGKARGTVLGSYAQAYSGYAVIREEYDNNATLNKGDANAYLALADSSQLVKDKALVTDATYTGTASYSTGSTGTTGAAVRTDLLTMTVKGDAISGYVYRTITSGSGVTSTRTYVQFRDANISVDGTNGVVGFNGNAFINASARGVTGTVPTATSDVANGTYKGVFAGPNAKEVVGTFETNSDVESSVRGAFAGTK